MPNGFRRMPLQPKVDSLQREVSGDQYVAALVLTTPARQKSEYGAVVSNSSSNGRIFQTRRRAANPGNQRFFRNRHHNKYKLRSTGKLLRDPISCPVSAVDAVE